MAFPPASLRLPNSDSVRAPHQCSFFHSQGVPRSTFPHLWGKQKQAHNHIGMHRSTLTPTLKQIMLPLFIEVPLLGALACVLSLPIREGNYRLKKKTITPHLEEHHFPKCATVVVFVGDTSKQISDSIWGEGSQKSHTIQFSL